MPTDADPVTIFCPKCRYNLTGLTRDVCPECGEAFDPVALRRQLRERPYRRVNLWFLLIAPALAFLSPIFIAMSPGIGAMVMAPFLFFAVLYFGLYAAFDVTLATHRAFGVTSESARSNIAVVVLLVMMAAVVIAFIFGVWFVTVTGLSRFL